MNRTTAQIETSLIKMAGKMALGLDTANTWNAVAIMVGEMRRRAASLTSETAGRVEIARVAAMAEKVFALASVRYAAAFASEGWTLEVR